ncbi:HEAT repeat domain-containing protein [Deinococcus hopiensis]|uniref:HEAT repeat-containing protein n=1 Tax=Deinococcus hopiensis KR-140 TaxID=695939 RepID=A0A1W1UJX7_9DEIO|nr:HEAT repeat domain-containing protein [Deinococcus hopiensis]SMB81352.1 HEAT repeat-containing protein [Deinococcus hopiensis KR-140]
MEAFEAQHGVRLPEAYRDFLVQVGNGGAGQAYGLYPLDKTRTGGVLNNPSPLHPDMPKVGDWYEVLGLDEDSEAAYDGALTLLTQGCTYDVLLMVSGPYRGQIVYVDWDMARAPHFSQFPDFLTWYETWLRESLAGYDMTWFGYGLPLDPEASVAVASDAGEPFRRREAALNNLMRAPTLGPELLAPLQGALMNEPDVELATDLLTVLASNGAGGLGNISWALLRQAQGRQIYRIVNAMKTAGLLDWKDAALWALEQDADQDASQSVLFMLKREDALTRRAIELAFASRHVVSTGLYVNSKFSDPLPVPDALFNHSDPSVRRSAAEYQPDDVLRSKVPLLLDLWDREGSDHVRQGWALKLGQFQEPAVTAALTAFLEREKSGTVRSALTRRLAEHRASQAVTLLIQQTQGDDPVLRLEAAEALGKIGDERARPALEALLSQEERPFRDEGGGGMGYAYTIADAARRAISALEERNPGKN